MKIVLDSKKAEERAKASVTTAAASTFVTPIVPSAPPMPPAPIRRKPKVAPF